MSISSPGSLLLMLSLYGCASEPHIFKVPEPVGTVVADDAELPWGETAGSAASRTVGSAHVALSADLSSGAWSTPGSLSTVRTGDVLFFPRGWEGNVHDEWIEVPLTLTFTSDDGALAEEVSATGTVWGKSDEESEFVAKLPFLEFGEPFASIVAQSSTAADAEGCVIGPEDTSLLEGNLEAGIVSFHIGWVCDGGNQARVTDDSYILEYISVP